MLSNEENNSKISSGLLIIKLDKKLKSYIYITIRLIYFIYNEKKLKNRSIFIKKLIYRSKYTGTRETDILLGNFAVSHLHNLSNENLISYQKLLESGDPRIWRLSIDVEKTNSDKENYIVNLIREFKGF